jgi:predicted HTH transcriptional regulator
MNGAINGAIKSELSKEENFLISYIIMNPMATYDECSTNLKIPKRTISRLLSNLRLKGIVIREGSKKSGKWKIVK